MKTPPFIKQMAGVLITVLLLLLAYYGSYLPFRKSQLFITTLQDPATSRSVVDFKAAFDRPLQAPSPIGQEELVRNLGNTILSILQSSGGKPDLIASLTEYLESYTRPIMERGRGMSFGQNLYIFGALNELAFVQTKDPRYLAAAKQYFEKALELGPRRPQSLYGMFDILRLEGNRERAIQIGEQIIAQWPDDERTKRILLDIIGPQQGNQKLTK